MSLDHAPDAYVLHAEDGDALWFADSLVTYKATGIETRGDLTGAEVRAHCHGLDIVPAPRTRQGVTP